MCYRCSICDAKVGPRVSLVRHVILRRVPKSIFSLETRTEIEKELPVCNSCKQLLDSGLSVRETWKSRGGYIRHPEMAPPPPAALPKPLPTVRPLHAESVFS